MDSKISPQGSLSEVKTDTVIMLRITLWRSFYLHIEKPCPVLDAPVTNRRKDPIRRPGSDVKVLFGVLTGGVKEEVTVFTEAYFNMFSHGGTPVN